MRSALIVYFSKFVKLESYHKPIEGDIERARNRKRKLEINFCWVYKSRKVDMNYLANIKKIKSFFSTL